MVTKIGYRHCGYGIHQISAWLSFGKFSLPPDREACTWGVTADLLSAYPPTAPLQTHLLTPLHPLLTPLLHLTSALLLTYLSQHFRQLIRDRMVLSAEVMREYDRRFVYKRVFASRVDRACQTEQAETVW